MAQWHLDEIRAAFEARGWRIAAELPGNDHDVSGSWELKRSGVARTVILDFEGLDDLDTLPLERAYGCRVRIHGPSLYFRRRGTNDPEARERWLNNLAAFVEATGESPTA